MRKVIHDCDNTLGIKGCDVDDGLAMLYLLGCEDIELIGITTTYGNNNLKTVYNNTKTMLSDIGREDIPVYSGGEARGGYESPAAHFLADMASKYPGELEILATGSLTNLYGAARIKPEFFSQIKQIVLMGGITEPLVFPSGIMSELNFSCDPKATFKVLTSKAKVATITGNNCLKVLFTREEHNRRLQDDSIPATRFIKERTGYWFDDMASGYGVDGFYNWDAIAAVYMVKPDLFENHITNLNLSEEDLKEGFLRKTDDEMIQNCKIALPEIIDVQGFIDTLYGGWLNARISY